MLVLKDCKSINRVHILICSNLCFEISFKKTNKTIKTIKKKKNTIPLCNISTDYLRKHSNLGFKYTISYDFIQFMKCKNLLDEFNPFTENITYLHSYTFSFIH